ncbi:MAG: MarR family transcriptional regulator, lower aerobic nicotinate degradation pathway regulator [Actinomycetota bacterium]|jgi:DNA-binding MarR family transcriptional regulator|nr:MarR family transcriptional regulator, lower aerobic nicotinate degradation pathway regulator [Actinomycetota bacterium]
MDANTAPARLKSTASWLLNQAALQATRLVTDGFGAAHARRYHYSMLAALEEFGPASQATLGRRCGIDRSDVVAMVNELADRDQLERTPDPADGRRNVITITPAGVRQLQRLDDVLGHVQDDLLAPLSEPERAQLTELLTRLITHHA